VDLLDAPRLSAEGRDVPRNPVRVLAGYVALALPALGIGFAAGLVWPDLLIAPVSLALAGVVQSARRWIELVLRRRKADRWLRKGGSSTACSWRTAELTSARERKLFARSLRSVIRELEILPFMSVMPLNRPGVRPYAGELELLERRLANLHRPVAPLGMLFVRDLLTEPESPLYRRASESMLPIALGRAHDALDVQPLLREGGPSRQREGEINGNHAKRR
jgi:hypothetical protein